MGRRGGLVEAESPPNGGIYKWRREIGRRRRDMGVESRREGSRARRGGEVREGREEDALSINPAVSYSRLAR